MWDRATPSPSAEREASPTRPLDPPIEHVVSSNDGPTGSTTTASDPITSNDGESTTTDDTTTTDASTTGELALASTDTTDTTDSTTGGQSLPQIPLPRLPGSRFMRRARRVDEQTGEPIITLGLSVPAPGAQVEAFYRRAMKDAGLKVFGGRYNSASSSDDYRSTLKGRSKYVSAELTIHQRSGKLRSVVRIYWRLRD